MAGSAMAIAGAIRWRRQREPRHQQQRHRRHGAMAQLDPQRACHSWHHCRGVASATRSGLPARAHPRRPAPRTTGLFQSACAASPPTPARTSQRGEGWTPPCRAGAAKIQGRGLSCLSSMPPSSAASGAEPPEVRNGAGVGSSKGEVILAGPDHAQHGAQVEMDGPSTTSAGETCPVPAVQGGFISPALANCPRSVHDRASRRAWL